MSDPYDTATTRDTAVFPATTENTTAGTVCQIAPDAPVHKALLGALMVVTEARAWGAIGYVDAPGEGRAYVRVPWKNLAWIGSLYWVPDDVIDELID